MTQGIQEHLLQLFEQVRLDPDTCPPALLDGWQEGSAEWRLLESFRGMVEQMRERIHQLKQAEEHLREQEELYHSAFEATRDGLFIGDLDGKIVEVNPAACEMYGYTHEEMMELTGFHLTHPASHPQLEELIAKPPSQGTRLRLLALRKDGSTFLSEGHLSTFIYQGKPHLLSVGRDVTEQVQAEQQLREKEEQYRGIFEATSDGLIIADLNGVIVEANPATCSIYGYAYEELLGLSPTALTHPDSLSQVTEDIQTIKEGNQVQARPIGLRKDGTSFYAEVHGTPFTYKGKPHALAIVRDVTKQVQAEEQLREKEEQYRSIFEAVTDSLSIARLEGGQIVEANPAQCKMFGYTYEEMIGLTPADLVHPDSLPLVAEGLEQFRTEGRSDPPQMKLLRKDGTSFLNEAHSTRFIYKGEPHLLTVSRDITERVEAERQLREQEEQYRSVFEATYDGLIISNLDGFVVEVNPTFCSMYGYTRDELIGLHVGALAAPESLPVLDEVLERRKTGMSYQTVVAQALRKDGTAFYVESHGTTFSYRGQPHTLGVVRDITERVQAEQQLREKEEQYRSIFEATYDGIDIFDADGYFVEVNPAFCRMFGYTREELIGMPASALVAPQYRPVLDEALETLGIRTATQTVVGQGVRKDGTAFYTESHGTPFTYKGKLHLLGVSRDITERVEKEEQYRGIFEASTDGLIISDWNGTIVEVNPAACRMFGYLHEEFIGLTPDATVHPDDLPQIAASLQTIQAGDQAQARHIALRKNGTTFPAEVHGTMFMYHGKPHSLGIVRDITERVEAEQQLREKEEQYRSVFEATDDGLVIQDLDGFFIEANPAFCHMLGYTHEELIGRHYSRVTYPEYYPVVEENTQKVQAEGRAQAQGYARRKDGSPLPVEAHSTAFTYRGKPHVLGVMRDITERVEAEQQLREREEQYRGIFEATYDALFIMDLDGFLVEVNPAFCRMFGYLYKEVIGLHSSVFAAPVSLPSLAESLQALNTGRNIQTQVGQGLRKDGTAFYNEAHSTTLTYRGKPHALGVIRDITERIEAEQQLREREEQYRSIFESTYDAINIIDLDGYFVEVNPAFCRMFGYSREELIGMHASATTTPETLPVLDDALNTFKAGGDYQTVVARGLRKDGTPFYAESHGTTLNYRGKPHALSVSRDVTERVEAERQLREREEQYRSVFEATYDALVVMDLDGYFVEVNPAFCNMFGYSREELIGKHGSITTAPETLPVLDDFLHTIKTQTNYQVPTGTRGVRKDGTLFYTESHATTLTYQGKSHMLGVIRDITEQMQAQQLLEQRVEERTRELASLLSISHTVASTLHLKPLVDLILDQLKTVVDYTSAAILTVEGDDLVLLNSRSPTPEEQLRQIRLLPQRLGLIWETIASGQSLLLPDMRDESPRAQTLRADMGGLMDTTFSYVRASLFVPLTLQDRVIGMLVLTSGEVDAFTEHHTTLAQAIANQAAIAIENARLYAQAQELAALEERQKLARELHDSVSQALYGISLGAHAARTASERDPGGVAEPLDYVLSLAEAALAEMRALIFELRPESLETEGLVSALSKQAAATQARHELVVVTDLCDEPVLSLHGKQELYRIAQEAMHNTVKHAHARRVALRLEQTDSGVVLEVRDDGVGFDASASFPGHLGLQSMRERVANLGGTFEIESGPEAGTCVCVRVPGGM